MAGDYPGALSSRVGRVGLNMKGFAALATLVSDGPTSQQQLSRRIRMDPATMVDVIDELEEAGYILRRRNPADRREYALQTTPKGRAIYARAERAIIEAERQTVRSLNPREAKTLMTLLTRLAER